jgi:hypothetical protein
LLSRKSSRGFCLKFAEFYFTEAFVAKFEAAGVGFAQFDADQAIEQKVQVLLADWRA